jgi:thiol-disulfide isomerase/thioredoxin
MKKIFTVLCLLLSTTFSLFGQTKPKTEPFIIRGQITNCQENNLLMHYDDLYGDGVTDTLKLDQSGNFYLKTFKVKIPQIINLHGNKFQIKDICIAPGYNLTITANWKDDSSLHKTLKITGIGAESNKYELILDSIRYAKMDTTNEFLLSETDFLTRFKKGQIRIDSIVHAIFDKKPIHDNHLKNMGELTRLNDKFSGLGRLIDYPSDNHYTYKKTVDFVRNNFDNDILNNIFRDDYLKSKEYKRFISIYYLYYLVGLDQKKDSTIHPDLGHRLEKVNKIYTGKAKEYALNSIMSEEIESCRSLEEINGLKEQFKPYISNLKDLHYKRYLNAKFTERVAEFMRTQVGKPAPKFVLESNLGKTYRLEDFKGKVVYMDLWASWCGPCRAESPGFKILYDKFRNNDQIAFISIAVSDGNNAWKKALEEDKPDWIQLIDKDNFVANSYVLNTIPKFILIDKKGNIVNFNAPRPSSRAEIEKLLNQEIAK